MGNSGIPHSSLASLGDLLKFLRRRERLSQRELSIATGYSESHISRIESNERPVDRTSLLALFVPALQIENETETINRLLAFGEQASASATSSPSASARIQLAAETLSMGRNRLPAQLTSLVGRREELAELSRLLAVGQTRLLTLTGAGGCGKTRLALKLGEETAVRYPHGVWLVELAPLADSEMVANAVASVLDIRERVDGSLLSSIADYLWPRQALLILDNCEHLVDPAAHLAAALLQACPGLQILATSRERLSVPGEINYPVQPLALPPRQPGDQPSVTDVESYDAIRLFVERGRGALHTFGLTDQNVAAVARICQRLDGIPLGIELAAVWLPVLSPDQIAVRLERSFDLLGKGQRALLTRHQTLNAAIAWSFDLLSEEERTLLLCLSVFNGGWTLEAAEEVAGRLPLLAEADILSVLQRLVNKSMVAVDRSQEGESRYRFLEAIWEFSHQRLVENGLEAPANECHLAYFMTLAERAEPRLKSAQQLYWLDVLDQEQENLRAALGYSLASGKVEVGLRLAGALGHYWEMRFYLVEGRRWCDALIAAAEAFPELARSPRRAKVLFASAVLAAYMYEDEQGLPYLNESLDIYRELGDPSGVGAVLCFVANGQDRANQPHEAVSTFQQAIECSQRAEDTWWIAEHLH